MATYVRQTCAQQTTFPEIKVNIDASLMKEPSLTVTDAPGERTETVTMWHKLIEGKILRADITTTTATATSAFEDEESTPLMASTHNSIPSSDLTVQQQSLPPQPVVTRKASFKKTMERAKENWRSLIGIRKTDYEKIENEKPDNVRKLFEKVPTTDSSNSVPTTPPKEFPEHDSQFLSVDVKTSQGNYENVKLQLTSPDKSILSAHIAENGDGTFTIFCCPTIDDSFNMFVSLQGKTFKHDVQVLNLYGSFAGLREKERELACKTINLIRWHLTPGLLKKEGDKLYPISTGLV